MELGWQRSSVGKKNKSQTKGLGPCLLKAEKLNTGISF
jgi:hypothetical protein